MSFTVASISVVGVAAFVKPSTRLRQSGVTDNLAASAPLVWLYYNCTPGFCSLLDCAQNNRSVGGKRQNIRVLILGVQP